MDISEILHLLLVIVTHYLTALLLKFSDTLKYAVNTLAVLSFLIRLLRHYFLVPFMFLPVIFMSKNPQHRNMLDALRNAFQQRFPSSCEFVTVTTNDGVKLDAVVYTNPAHVDTPFADRKWLIWMCPNGGAYEEFLEFFEKYAEAVGFSVVSFNYRGVVRSEGFPIIAEDLVRDGEAVMYYLIEKGVKSENILIHGHSMGGGVGAVVRSRFPNGPVINDRSFRSLEHAIKALVKQERALGALVGVLIGFTGGFLAGGTLSQTYGSAIMYGVLSGAAVGYLGHKSVNVLFPVLSAFVSVLGWAFDVEGPWNSIHGYKVIIYHSLDGVVSYDLASLHNAVRVKETTENDETSTRYVKLDYKHYEGNPIAAITKSHQVYHVYPLDTIQAEWGLIVSEAKRALRINNN